MSTLVTPGITTPCCCFFFLSGGKWKFAKKKTKERTGSEENSRMGGTGGGQQFCLRWNNHRSNLLTVFEQLLQTEAFTDVTLAVNGASVKCHKMVLAACSSYFQTLFQDNPSPHPIVVFKDIQYAEVRAILEFMYRGEVNVEQQHVAALLKAAQALRVKGRRRLARFSFLFFFSFHHIKLDRQRCPIITTFHVSKPASCHRTPSSWRRQLPNWSGSWPRWGSSAGSWTKFVFSWSANRGWRRVGWGRG